MSFIIINLKTYREGTASRAEVLVRQISNATSKFGGSAKIYIAAQSPDICRLRKLGIKIIAQHLDNVQFGPNTGKDLAECLKENGACGVLINHAEDPSDDIKTSIKRCRETGLLSVVCVDKIKLAAQVAKLNPDFVALELPHLIGKKSITKSNPEFIKKAVHKIRKANKNVRILCGSGISEKEDFSEALRMGCDGIILSSAVVKSKNPGRKMAEFLSVTQ